MARLTASKRPALTAPDTRGEGDLRPASTFARIKEDSSRPRIWQNPQDLGRAPATDPNPRPKYVRREATRAQSTKGSYATFKQLLQRTKAATRRFESVRTKLCSKELSHLVC